MGKLNLYNINSDGEAATKYVSIGKSRYAINYSAFSVLLSHRNRKRKKAIRARVKQTCLSRGTQRWKRLLECKPSQRLNTRPMVRAPEASAHHQDTSGRLSKTRTSAACVSKLLNCDFCRVFKPRTASTELLWPKWRAWRTQSQGNPLHANANP